MATPTTGVLGLTGDTLIDAMTNGYYWSLDASRTVDWSISNGWQGEYWVDPASAQVHIETMFAMFSYYADIKFTYVGYYSTPGDAYQVGSEINVAWDSTNIGNTSVWAIGLFPRPWNMYSGDAGDIYLNLSSLAAFLPTYEPGSAGWALGIHEIGHTLGLKHPHDDGGTGRPTFVQLGVADWDVDVATIMSYNDDFNWNLRQWEPATPMILDVLAIQYLYGKNLSSGAGDSAYQLYRTGAYGTLWDANGNDLVSIATQDEGWFIALPDIQLSSLVDTKVGFAVPIADFSLASPTTMFWLAGNYENAAGSSAADIITGSSANNVLRGNGGNDWIDGGTGLDVAVYSGLSYQYTISENNGAMELTGQDGSDTLFNVERLKFDNVWVAYDTSGSGGQAYRLYQAAFNRAPDIGGLGFQIAALDAGWSLVNISQNFIDSPEFSRTYGSLTDAQFVTQLYANVLHRLPDSGGLAFHVNNLVNGLPRSYVLVGFSESPENQAALIGVIENGMVYTV